jgi:hypothetical protein
MAHTPRTAAQLGIVEFALGYSVDAAAHLAEGLAASNDVWIGKNRTVLEKVLTEVRATIGEVEVTGAPTGAEVLVNGKSAGQLPLTSAVPTNQGAAIVELRASEFVTSSATTHVVGGKRTLVHIELQRERDLAAVPSPTPPAAAIVDSPGSRQPATEMATTSSTRSIVGWTLAAAGVASAAVGGILLLTASDCTPSPGFECAYEPASRIPGWTFLGAGLATGVAGAVVLVTRPTANTQIGLGPSYVLLQGRL